ncbi:MAG TPA: ABC transporter ATP-binding protein [Flavitalea sp.]|nr:ABC transporter ATP-binding protein [Flavitalea sp.]
MNHAVIQTDQLCKQFGSFPAVDHLNIEVARGSICGFLGQNGAGKSTTIKMLLGMTHPTSGSGKVLGFDISKESQSLEIRKKTAYVAEDKRLYDYMTASQIIQFTRSFFPMWNLQLEKQLLKEFGLPADRRIRKFSKGMRTQLALILGVCRNAELLVLDEPSEGLDPVNNEKMLRLLVGLAAEGKTIFFSSHQVFEVEQIADQVIMINKGRLIDNAPLDTLRNKYKLIKAFFDSVPEIRKADLPNVKSIRSENKSMHLFVRGNYENVISRLQSYNPLSIDVIDLNLKEIFLENLKAEENHVAV